MLGDSGVGGHSFTPNNPLRGARQPDGNVPIQELGADWEDTAASSWSGNQSEYDSTYGYDNSRMLEDQLQKLAYFNAMNMVASQMLEQSASKRIKRSEGAEGGNLDTGI